MMDLQADAAERLRTYKRLAARNRFVAVLRIGVPAFGVLLLAGLMVQIYISNLASRFGIDSVSIDRDTVTVESPQYSGLLDDGSAYRVWASFADAPLAATDRINLTDAAVEVVSPKGMIMSVTADVALLDTSGEVVLVDGEASFSDSEGTYGTFSQSVFDARSQTLDSQGPVDIVYADGTALTARTMLYDAKAMRWTFSGVNVTLPDTPASTGPGDDSP